MIRSCETCSDDVCATSHATAILRRFWRIFHLLRTNQRVSLQDKNTSSFYFKITLYSYINFVLDTQQHKNVYRWADATKFLTGASAVGSIAIPVILKHAGVIGWGALSMTLSSFFIFVLAIVCFIQSNSDNYYSSFWHVSLFCCHSPSLQAPCNLNIPSMFQPAYHHPLVRCTSSLDICKWMLYCVTSTYLI